MTNFLIVSKDIGGGNVAAPLAATALEHGDRVTVITEGLAPASFRAEGIEIFFQGTPNLNETPFSLDAEKVLNKIKPDVIVATEGSPINLEQTFGRAANVQKIPLVFLEDCHGGFVRTIAVPDLVLTVDLFAADLAFKAFPKSQVRVVGHPGVPTQERIALIKDRHLGKYRRNGIRTYTYVGGSPEETTEQLSLLMGCLDRTVGEWVLITRFHPKWADVQNPATGKTYAYEWNAMLASLGARHIKDPVGNGQELVAAADVSIADFSTLLTTAVCCGKTAIFLETPGVLVSMKQTTGLEKMPLVALGCAHRVVEPTNLGLFSTPQPDKLRHLKPYDPVLAYNAICEFLKK